MVAEAVGRGRCGQRIGKREVDGVVEMTRS